MEYYNIKPHNLLYFLLAILFFYFMILNFTYACEFPTIFSRFSKEYLDAKIEEFERCGYKYIIVDFDSRAALAVVDIRIIEKEQSQKRIIIENGRDLFSKIKKIENNRENITYTLWEEKNIVDKRPISSFKYENEKVNKDFDNIFLYPHIKDLPNINSKFYVVATERGIERPSFYQEIKLQEIIPIRTKTKTTIEVDQTCEKLFGDNIPEKILYILLSPDKFCVYQYPIIISCNFKVNSINIVQPFGAERQRQMAERQRQVVERQRQVVERQRQVAELEHQVLEHQQQNTDLLIEPQKRKREFEQQQQQREALRVRLETEIDRQQLEAERLRPQIYAEIEQQHEQRLQDANFHQAIEDLKQLFEKLSFQKREELIHYLKKYLDN